MFKTLNIVQNEGVSIARSQCGKSAVNVQAVDHAGLRQVGSAEVMPQGIVRGVCNQMIE